MKKTIYLALMTTLPVAAFAQPTIHKAMDYTIGTSVKFVNSDHIAPGPGGANKNWDMSGLTNNDTTTLWYMAPTAGVFAGATLMEKSSDSTYQYYNKANGGMYQVGMVDSTVGGDTKMTYTNSILNIKNVLTYNMTAKDTFAETISSSGLNITGEGTVNMVVDGYGTLKLPTGTFSNVLRIRVERIEKDTIPPPIGMSFNTQIISYMWFDDAHRAPICRADSTDAEGTQDQTSGYLLEEKYPLSVGNTQKYTADFNATFNQNQLVLSSNFDKTKQYDIAVFNIAGQKIFTQTFTAQNNTQVFDINSDVLPGIYMVYLQEKGNTANAGIQKISKQ